MHASPLPEAVIEPVTQTFTGAAGNRLLASRYGEHGEPVLLLHGGGQTRHAWAGSAATLARQGRVAYTLDQRGHGDSDWVGDGDYRHRGFAADLERVADEISRRHGARPFAIGASFGGLIALLAQGQAARERQTPLFRGLVFVDISLRTDPDGADRIRAFMRTHANEGFASVDEAAEVVAAYTPHRPRPKNTRGLQKNLRQRPDGRWRWHWDPRFIDGGQWIDSDRALVDPMLIDAARALTVPALLVRGASSELVLEEHAREFLALSPHIEYVDVAGARHMVVGDANDQFSATLGDFLDRAAARA